jgi:hypothetical protein
MTVSAGIAAYVKPHITKETKSTLVSTFSLEDGTLKFTLDAPVDAGIVQAVDLNNPSAISACKVKGVTQSVKNPNVATSQSFTKLAGSVQGGFAKLMEHANTLAAPAGQ